MASKKPKTIEAGRCYRLYRWAGCGFGSREPGESIAYVYAIEGDRRRCVRLRTVDGPELGYNAVPYFEFRRMVHSAADNVKN